MSNERLESYRLASDDDAGMIARYLWNIALGEALYPSLQCLEIALRNSIHNTISAAFGTPNWFDTQLLKPTQLEQVMQAKRALTAQSKPLEPGRIIAELSFGFWTSLLNAPYEAPIWQKYLRPVFPHAPRKVRTRSTLARKLNGVRQLRNRIFHHEPIWHWLDLEQKHADIVATVGWISPELQTVLRKVDRFSKTYTAGSNPFKELD